MNYLSFEELTLEHKNWETDPRPLVGYVEEEEEVRFIIGIPKSTNVLILRDTEEGKDHPVSNRDEGIQMAERIRGKKRRNIWI